MVISWTARKPTLYLLHGLVLSWTHCKPTLHTAPAISRAPILSLPPILQGPRNSNWSPPTISSGDSSHCHHIFTFINHWNSLNFNCWCSCLSHYSPESWQVVNMEYLHWGYGICKGCMYVLSIEYKHELFALGGMGYKANTVNMEYLHWWYGVYRVCRKCRYVLSIKYWPQYPNP